jgi:peptidoglycan/LPS O-acetylase OafA/YrhL
MASGARSPGLDGLRGLAILMVLLTHYGASLNRASLPQHIVRSIFDFGWTGVDLFFVLSGFLITGILLQSKEAENYFSAFYARRVLRIFPLYYFSLLVLFLLVMPNLSDGHPPAFWRKIAYFVYIQNWLAPQQWMGQYWTLAVEEQFYLVWPLVVFCFPRERVLRIAVGASILAVILRFSMLALQVNPEVILENSFTRMDTLLIGATCACLRHEDRWARRLCDYAKWLCFSPAVVMPVLYLVDRNLYRKAPIISGMGYTLIALSYGALLLALVSTAGEPSMLQRLFGSSILRTLGKYSYAAYIWHILVRVLVDHFQHDVLHGSLVWFMRIPLLIGLTLLVSMLSYALIERPFLSLKRYFEPRFAAPLKSAVTFAH